MGLPREGGWGRDLGPPGHLRLRAPSPGPGWREAAGERTRRLHGAPQTAAAGPPSLLGALQEAPTSPGGLGHPGAGGDGDFLPSRSRREQTHLRRAAGGEEPLGKLRAEVTAPGGPAVPRVLPPTRLPSRCPHRSRPVPAVPRQCPRVQAVPASQVRGRAGGPAPPHGAAAMGAALSTGAVVAISFNCIIALLILILFLILCKACRTPSCPKKGPPSDADEARNEEKYLLQP